jgi:predicted nucleic acid-binding protein
MPSAFLDTNILLYAAAGERNEPAKAEMARRLIGSGDFGISVQVLQEFLVNAGRPSIGLADEEIDSWITDLLEFECVTADTDMVLHAILVSRSFQISYWDAAIVAAAERLGAESLYTEDLSHGQRYGPVRVLNPFLEE